MAIISGRCNIFYVFEIYNFKNIDELLEAYKKYVQKMYM
jgi:hypothetical protein